MNTINYFPIFKQGTQWVLDDFKQILHRTMPRGCSDADVERRIADIAEIQKKRKYTFALGAFDGTNMVGFTSGLIAEEESKKYGQIENLFVLPEYARNKIGSRLQSMAEKIFSFCSVNETLSVVYASDATLNFMRHNGYREFRSGNVFIKDNLPLFRCDAVPVFYLANRSWYNFTKFKQIVKDMDADKFAINRERRPAYMYMNENSEICGYAIGDDSGNIQKMQIFPHQPADWIRKRLTARFDELHALYEAKQAQKSRGK